MYARGNNAFGQQSYTAQSAYGKSMGAAYPGSSAGGPDKGSQISMAGRNSALLNGQEADIAGLRAHPSAPAHYGGQYSSVYGSAPLSSTQQVPALGSKGVGHAALESRGVYASVMPESPTFATGDYLSSSRGYGHKSDQLFSEKVSDFPSIERRQFGERPSGYVGRGLLSESSGRFTDSTFASQQQELYDRIDQSVLIRQEQLLKGQSMQSNSVDGAGRQPDYLAAKGPTIRNPTQDLMPYAGRMDADPRGLTMLSGSSYGGQHAPSILGAAPRRNVDDLMYNQSSSNPGYGVSLPPGRDYATGKGLHAASLDADYPSSLLSRGHSRIDDHKDDRVGYVRELELREEERRRDRLRDREREREREKDRDRLRARERERERERERDRVRERERERERMLERRVRDRDREHKHGVDVRRERTPLRISKDRRGSSLTREGRMLRRDSPRLEALHRRHSPVKEKRRDYVCKVYSSSLVDVERDYLAIDKRYPKLFISPEFSKVVVNWPKDDLKLSLHTPVSFEHDFIEESVAEKKHALTNLPAEKFVKPEMGHTVWNAKMILMSGISRNALEELSSEKSLDDRIPHICNILRFAVIRKDHSFMAIGGRWDAVDGTDPSVDRSSLVRTVQRYAKDVTQLDLHDCCHWNSFIEIHYDRIGKDGLFSHKEVTVLFVPDLSHSLPSLDAWRAQWLAHKKSIAERENQISLKKQKSIEKKEVSKDKGSVKDIQRTEESDIKKESTSPGKIIDVNEKEKDGSELNGLIADIEGTGNEKDLVKKNADAVVEEGKPDEEKVESSGTQTSGSAKTVKKKVVRKIVKPKVSGKKPVMKNESDTQNDNLNGNDGVKNIVKSKGLDQEGSSTVKTFVRKKVVKKDSVEKAAAKEEVGAPTEVKSQVELDCSKDNPKLKSDASNTVAVKKSPLKTITRKKIVKVKRKVSALAANAALADGGKEGNLDEEKVVEAVNVAEISKEQGGDAEDQVNESEQKVPPKTKSKTGVDKATGTSKTEVKADKENKKEEKGIDEKSGLGGKLETEPHGKKVSPMNSTNGDGSKSREKDLKVEKEKKDKDVKEDLKSKSGRDRDAKEKKRLEEPPRHPGLILQMRGSKDSKLHSLSLSLDSLLDYTEKDVEESTFEISLFAESLYEMLQFQMGCRILTFLQKLRLKYVLKRNKQKRQRDEDIENETKKRLKAESSMETESVKHEKLEGSHQDVEKPEKDKSIDEADVGKLKDKVETEDDPEGGVGKEKLEDLEEEDPEDGDLEEGDPEGDLEEDPEEDLDEDPEEDLDGDEDEEMVDAGRQSESSDKENVEGRDAKVDGEPENVVENEKDVLPESAEMKTSKITAESEPPSEEAKVESEKKEAQPVNKEALQAFRFFDRSRVGYIRVEDMRLIIHSLGKLLSHRDVKELVQSALLESNTGRDDRILYNKLVRMRFE